MTEYRADLPPTSDLGGTASPSDLGALVVDAQDKIEKATSARPEAQLLAYEDGEARATTEAEEVEFQHALDDALANLRASEQTVRSRSGETG